MSFDRDGIITRLQSKIVTLDEFNFDNLSAPPMYAIFNQYDIDRLYNIATSIRYSGNAQKKYNAINEIMKPRGFRKLSAGTNRVAYKFMEDDRFVAKVAADAVGIKDSPREFKNQFLLKPFVTKIFEVSPCGVLGMAERVDGVTSREEFVSISDDVYHVIFHWIIGKYIMADIGTKYFMNWGLRRGFGPVLLDFPYLYELDYDKLYCKAINPYTGHKCTGTIDYDSGFNHLYCNKCGSRYRVQELAKAIDNNIIQRKDKFNRRKTNMEITVNLTNGTSFNTSNLERVPCVAAPKIYKNPKKIKPSNGLDFTVNYVKDRPKKEKRKDTPKDDDSSKGTPDFNFVIQNPIVIDPITAPKKEVVENKPNNIDAENAPINEEPVEETVVEEVMVKPVPRRGTVSDGSGIVLSTDSESKEDDNASSPMIHATKVSYDVDCDAVFVYSSDNSITIVDIDMLKNDEEIKESVGSFLQDDFDNLCDENAKLEADNKEYIEKIKSLEKALESKNSEKSADHTREDEIAHLRETIDSQRTEINSLREANGVLESDINELNTVIDTLKAENSDITNKVSMSNNMIALLEGENDKLKEENDSLKKENAEEMASVDEKLKKCTAIMKSIDEKLECGFDMIDALVNENIFIPSSSRNEDPKNVLDTDRVLELHAEVVNLSELDPDAESTPVLVLIDDNGERISIGGTDNMNAVITTINDRYIYDLVGISVDEILEINTGSTPSKLRDEFEKLAEVVGEEEEENEPKESVSVSDQYDEQS